MSSRKNGIIAYFDSGTTNTRIYLLDRNFHILCWKKKAIGSKDSAISGSSRILITGMKALYDEALASRGFTDCDVEQIFASGMVTSPYGLEEVPHCQAPVTVGEFSRSLYRYREDVCFQRDIILVPGLKTDSFDFSFVNNMRGEEIQVIGALDEIKELPGGSAVILPGSHTHVAYVKGERIKGILSSFTGELFYALKEETILAPILSGAEDLNEKMVERGYRSLIDFGFNRAIYIAHAMRIFEQGSPKERFSFAEGVINGGVRQAIEYYCANVWPDCRNVILMGNEFMYQLYSCLFRDSNMVSEIIWLRDTDERPYGVKGLEKIIRSRGE
ncbi:2-dehydro-3-deoxygalactonokinase [Anaerovorax odorimutans]|uniref:2-dehydro-3-deoxygalactonokinase n=1 Tax=Anaerovorax odorimutans TaxID=109327 RepID=A0ABT1RQF5_9FIRM|nr:2-dehydro-3-deoxygalactonokinase [Anaerovorax odorimutans]MCQ4637424.1 2-dehydro-3-deoxygalactonokinase [Anaerovorax odorimutans]